MKKGRNIAGNKKRTLDLVEETVLTLRQGGIVLALPYLSGTIPFVLGLLYFVSDMSRSPFAGNHVMAYSLTLAVLFVWMKTCQMIFVQTILAGLYGQEPPRISQVLRVMPVQAFIHALGFIVLPIAATMALPFGWAFAFFQNVLCIDLHKPANFTAAFSQASKQTMLWPAQNHLVLFTLSAFGLAVWANIFAFMWFMPLLLKILLGVETRFVMSLQHSVFNTTFIFSCMGLTYMCVDPFIKAAYALRCYYGSSIASGEDLKAGLRKLKQARTLITVVAVCLLLTSLAGSPGAWASQAQEQSVSQPQLEESIREVMQEPVFSWRLPQDITPDPEDSEPGFLQRASQWLSDQIEAMFKTIRQWLRDFWIWLEDKLPDFDFKEEHEDTQTTHINWGEVFKAVVWGLLIIAVVFLAVMIAKIWKKRTKIPVSDIEEAVPLQEVNILDEEVTADLLETNAWLEMAKKLMAQGAYLEAMRAFYLAALSQLAQDNMISIARYKSNLEYKTELRRRASDKAELQDLFSNAVKVFEKHWYGTYPVDSTVVNEIAHCQNRIQTIVQHT